MRINKQWRNIIEEPSAKRIRKRRNKEERGIDEYD